MERYQIYKEKNNYINLFEGYTYVNIGLVQVTISNHSNTRMTTKHSKQLFTTNSNSSIKSVKNPVILQQSDISISPKNKPNLNNNLIIYEIKIKKYLKPGLKEGDLNSLALTSCVYFNLNCRNSNSIRKISELKTEAKIVRNGSVSIFQKYNKQHLIENNLNLIQMILPIKHL